MLVGYMAKYKQEEAQLLKIYGAERIISRDASMSEADAFRQCLVDNQNDEVVVVDLVSLGETLTLIQLLDEFLWLRSQGKSLYIIKQGLKKRIPNDEYQNFLIELGEVDRQAIVTRTKIGVEQARLEGRLGGRPKIDTDTVARLQFLYKEERMTIRQIAAQCEVSIGTVWKYIQETT